MMSSIINSNSLQSEESFDFLFKIVLIGDCGTGKTCVVQRFRTGTFMERQGSTIGVDFSMKTIVLDGKKIKLQIWDTAGQERFRTITQSYYRSANGVIIVYDITKRATFLNLQRWIEEVRRYTSKNVMLILVGKVLECNKCDLENEREVELSEAQDMRDYVPEIMYFVETSAKEDKNIDDIFYYLSAELKKQHDQLASVENTEPEDEPINLSDSEPVSRCNACSVF